MKDKIDQLIEYEKDNKEYHIPGYNYCGPGTRVVTRHCVDNNKGINELDEACRIHDIEYMKNINSKKGISEQLF